MIDKVKIFAKAGDGGNGCTSSRRSRHDRKAIADGAFSSSFLIMLISTRFDICWGSGSSTGLS